MEKPAKTEWIRVIEASAEELASESFLNTLSSPLLAHYAKAINLFMRGKEEELLSLSVYFNNTVLEPLAQLRVAIRQKKLHPNFIQEQISACHHDSLLEGEALFLAALAYEHLGRNEESASLYRKATTELSKLGALKKAIKAKLNALVMESRIHTDKHYLEEYFFLYREAKQLRDRHVAGTALLNLSREYQKIGALQAALAWVKKSIALQAGQSGSLSYQLALLHASHVYLEMQKPERARFFYEQTLSSKFPEIIESRKIIYSWMHKKKIIDIQKKYLTPTWQERLEQGLSQTQIKKKRLGPTEEKILTLLSEGPKEKYKLIELLYGQDNIVASENRLKQIIHRLRKKEPNLIHYENGIFFLDEYSAPDRRKAS